MIIDLFSIEKFILAVYYCSDGLYRISIINDRGIAFDLDSIFFCQKLAQKEARAIVRTLVGI